MSSLRIRHLDAGYGANQVLEGVSLDIDQGRTLAVLGPSGCGKTTLLMCIAGLVDPWRGTVEADGVDITRLAAERRRIALVHQENTLFPHLDVRRNVEFGLRLLGVPAAARAGKVEHLLDLVDLRGFGARRVDELSGGEKQRVALARALAVEPRVLLLDEPLASLDRNLRVRLREELRRLLHNLSITTIFVTHDQEEAAWMGDSMVLMAGGRVVDDGTPERVQGRPASRAAARLLGRRNLLVYERGRDGGLVTAIGILPSVDGAPDKGTVMVREEHVEITPDGRGIPAVILEHRTLGPRTLFRLDVSGQTLIADSPAIEAPEVGTHVGLHIGAQALHVLRGEDPLV